MARSRILYALLGLLAILALAPAQAGAATWVVRGAGFGHGVGMSAYGAYGFGVKGAGYRQILGHYYRGIRIGPAPRRVRQVRVLIDAGGAEVSFTRATAACGRELDPRRNYRGRLRGGSVLLLSNSGRPLARCGPRLRAESAGVIEIGGAGSYRGALELVPGGGASLNVVNALNVNNYARGTLPAEVPPEWPMATLKAFAVAVRSIALSTDVGGAGFQLYPDTRTQVYKGLAGESRRTDLAVRATGGEVALFGGEVAQTTYFSSSGGRTESGFLGAPDVPYLSSVPDPYDDYSPQHRWTVRFSQAEMNSRLGPYLAGSLRRIQVTQRGDSPRIDYARLIGTRGTTTIRGDTLQYALGLYDRWAYFRRVP